MGVIWIFRILWRASCLIEILADRLVSDIADRKGEIRWHKAHK